MNKKELLERKRKAEEELTAIAERYAEEALAANVKSLEAAVNSEKKTKMVVNTTETPQDYARQVVMRNQVLNTDGTRAVFEQPQPPHPDFVQQIIAENLNRRQQQMDERRWRVVPQHRLVTMPDGAVVEMRDAV